MYLPFGPAHEIDGPAHEIDGPAHEIVAFVGYVVVDILFNVHCTSHCL